MSALIRVVLSQKELQIEPGQKGELLVTVQNLSEIVDQYIVEVEGLDPEWFSVFPSRVSLFPQDPGQVQVTLHPPPAAKAGQYDFSVRATSRENPTEATRVQATLEVMPVFLFEMSLSPQRRSTMGQEASFQVRLANPGNVDLTFNLSATDPEEGCTYLFQPQRVVVTAGGSRDVPLVVTPKEGPSEQARLYPFTVKAVPVGAPHKARTATGQLECKPFVISFEIGLWPQRVSATGVGTFQVQVANRGSSELTLDLEGVDPGEECAYRFQPPRVRLRADESQQIPLTVGRIGGPPVKEPVTYDFMVRGTPLGAPNRAKQVTGQFECLPVSISFELGLSPQKVTARGEGTFQVQLANTGDTEITLELSGADAQGACHYSFQSQRVRLRPGETEQAPLRVTPRRSPPRGKTASYELNITATPPDAPHLARTTAGQLEILRPKRRWGYVLGMVALLALLVAFLLFWSSYLGGGAIRDLLSGLLSGPVPTEPAFWAEPDVITRGRCAILRWRVGEARGVGLEGPGVGFEVPPEGEREVCPEDDAEYFLIVNYGPEDEEILDVMIRVMD